MTSTSIWMRDAGLPTWAALDADRREDVVIVGAGLAGLGLAQALRRRGLEPLVVDAHGPAAGASGRNAGFVLRAHVTELPALIARVGKPLVTELLALAADNHARARALAGVGDPGRYRASGSAMLASGAKELRLLADAHAALVDAGVRASEVSVPHGLEGFDAALGLDDDGELHPGQLLASLADGVRGARMHVRALDAGGVSDGVRRIEAGQLVVATNAWIGELLPSLEPHVQPNRAQMLATEPVALTLEIPCYAGLGFDYFRQRRDGRVLLGGRRHLFVEAERTRDESTSPEVQEALEAYLARHLPFARGARVEERWSGIMAFTPDGLPLAGRAPCAGGQCWVLGGWTGHGLGLSLAVGDRLAARIVGAEARDAVLDALAPSRLA